MTPSGTAKALRCDPAEIRRALSLFFESGDVVELRALNTAKGTQSGYFDDLSKLADAAAQLSGQSPGTYVVLNRITPELLARSVNRVTPYCKVTTADRDIVLRRWLPIDFDAVRPTGVSANDVEHKSALAKARECAAYLATVGFPRNSMLIIDSGNGGHVLARVDLPNDEPSKALIQNCLQALDLKFSDDHVKVDQTTYNAARIWKLPGTLAAKGDSTADRPHRIARILAAPEALAVAPRAALEALAHTLPEARPRTSGRTGGFDLQSWLALHGVQVTRSEPYQGGVRYILEQCVFNPDHKGTSAAAFQRPDGKLGYKCQHDGCQEKTWADVRKLLEQHPDGNTPSVCEAAHSLAWPQPLDDAAFLGLAGDVVTAIRPHTEADDAALLVNFVTAFGSAVGRGPHCVAEADRHGANIFAVLAGQTSKARKGSSWGHVRELFERADPIWAEQVAQGLSSGEGLIYAVRDPIERTVPVKEKGRHTGDYETIIEDSGVTDKRVLVVESEFSAVLKVMSREGNTLSPVLRSAWDTGNLRTLTKNSPARATGAHISILGHITQGELLRYLNDTEMGNGFANRFLWVCTRRARVLPEGGGTPNYGHLVERLHTALERGRETRRVERDDLARRMWADVYPELSEGRPGLVGAVCARAEAQVLRLSLVYAVLDAADAISPAHLKAALAVWEYAEASARYIFGDATGDHVADQILRALRCGELTRTAISGLLGRNVAAARIENALRALEAAGLARSAMRAPLDAGGRPSEVWHAG